MSAGSWSRSAVDVEVARTLEMHRRLVDAPAIEREPALLKRASGGTAAVPPVREHALRASEQSKSGAVPA